MTRRCPGGALLVVSFPLTGIV